MADKVNVGWVTDVKNKTVTVKVTKDYMTGSFTFDDKTKMFFPGFKGIGQTPQGPAVGMGVKYRTDKNGRATVLMMAPPLKPAKPIANFHQKPLDLLFKTADENQDNQIDIVEYSIYFRGSGKRSPKHFPAVFCGKYDQDKDEKLSFEEFKTVIMNLPAYKQKLNSPEEWMKLADKNKDGEIDVKEFTTTIPAVGHTEKVVPRHDKDKSGGLSLEELKSWLEKSTE